jgi:hypothetical protein
VLEPLVLEHREVRRAVGVVADAVVLPHRLEPSVDLAERHVIDDVEVDVVLEPLARADGLPLCR